MMLGYGVLVNVVPLSATTRGAVPSKSTLFLENVIIGQMPRRTDRVSREINSGILWNQSKRH